MLQLIQNLKTLGPVKEARHESYRFVITLFEKSKTENSGETESRLGLPGAAEWGQWEWLLHEFKASIWDNENIL